MDKSRTHYLIFAGLLTALTALGGLIRIPFWPAPFTLQTLFTILAGALLPPRYAFMSQFVYLLMGLAGLPVFANGGGLGYLFQPTFGYLLCLPVAAFTISFFTRKFGKNSSFKFFFLINMVAAVLILFFGTMWLYFVLHFILVQSIGFNKVIISGFIIFLPSEFLKALFVAYITRHLYTHSEIAARLK